MYLIFLFQNPVKKKGKIKIPIIICNLIFVRINKMSQPSELMINEIKPHL